MSIGRLIPNLYDLQEAVYAATQNKKIPRLLHIKFLESEVKIILKYLIGS